MILCRGLLVVATLIAASVADAANSQRSMSGSDFALVQKVIATVTRTERQFDPSKFDIVITEGSDDLYVTFQPPEWESDGYTDSAPGKALEVIVRKKGIVIDRWYWTLDRRKELYGP